ncbi:MAG: glycosyl hydrolase family 18 protein [Candidatus Pacebacteria bacterium]|nr:glycosyl hydrolase family 18 protein [Candidatus Paceibacterota bacterium]
MPLSTKIFFVGALLLISAPLEVHAAIKAAPLEVSGWLPYWRVATSTADVLPHLSSLTSVMPFGYTVRNDGTLFDAYGLGSPTSSTSPLALALITAAKAAKVRVVPTVMWSNGAAIHATLSNKAKRIALEDRIAALAKSQGFDGIDIDFEGKQAKTKPYFSLFLEGLYRRMGKKFVYCAIEARTPLSSRYDGTPPPDATTYANDFVAINKYCDRVELMVYDQQTVDVRLNKAANGAPYIPVSDVQWVEKVVNLAAKTISKKKLMIGVATYGYEWEVTPLSESGYRYDLQWAFNPRYALELAASLGITPVRNSAGEMSFLYTPTTTPMEGREAVPPQNSQPVATTAISYEGAFAGVTRLDPPPPQNILWWSDAQAIADKIALAKKLGVRGVAIFKLDGGEDQALWNLFPKRP